MKKKNINVVRLSFFLTLLLVAASWIFIFVVEDAEFWTLFTEKNFQYTRKFIGGLFGVGEEYKAFRDIKAWENALKLTYETLQMSVMAIGFATAAMIITVIPAARNSADGTLTLTKKWYRWIVFGVIRCIYIFSRSVPELVWAMVIVFIFKPGILPGALALAIHNFGILGKLCAEVVEDLDLRPIRNLASSGATSMQILFYGVIPTVMPKFLTYILYRGEVILRTTIVVGFVGAGGLGQEFKLAMSYFKYTDISLLLMCYLLLVVLADFISEGSRKLSE